MATISTHAETIQKRQLSMPKQELLDLLWAQGKLPTVIAGTACLDVAFDDDDGLTVAWTVRESHDVKEDV